MRAGITIMAGCALALLAAFIPGRGMAATVPATQDAAGGSDWRERIVTTVRRHLAEAEEARLAGDCYNRGRALSRAADAIATFGAPTGDGALGEGMTTQSRLEEAAARALPCPPPGVAERPSPYSVGQTAPPPAPRTSSPTVGPTSGQVQILAPLTAGIDVAIAACDRAAFAAAKNRVLEAIGRMLSQSPTDAWLLGERRRIEETQFPDPCPPASGQSSIAPPHGYQPGAAFARAGAAFSVFGIPRTPIGFVRDGAPGVAPEQAADKTRRRVNTTGVELGIYLLLRDVRVGVSGGYVEGDADTDFDVAPATGRASGSVYGALSPGNSSGISAPFGVAGQTRVDLSQFRLGATVDLLEPQPAARLFLSFDYFQLDRTHSLSLACAGTSGGFNFQFAQQRTQDLSDRFFAIGAGGEVRIPLGDTLSVTFNGSGAAYLRDSSLESRERNTNNFSAAADRDFTIDIEESHSGVGFRGQAGVTFELMISPTISVVVGGSADYWSKVGASFSPGSGDQVFFEGLTTGLRTDDAFSLRGGIGLGFAF